MLTFLSLWGKNPTWFHNLHLHAFATLFWKCAGLIGSQVICALTQLKAYYSRGAVIRGGRGLFVLSYFSGSFFFFFQFIKSLFEAVTFFFFLPLFGDGFLWILKVGNCKIPSGVLCFTRIFFVWGRLALALLDRVALFHFQANRCVPDWDLPLCCVGLMWTIIHFLWFANHF